MDIQPEKQHLDQAFSSTVYFIDFYQRDYKWTEEPVKRLLADIFYSFDEVYAKYKDLSPSKENVDRFPWYYLSTYVTNRVEGREFVVDGQQRLTTLTLLLIKLIWQAEDFKSKTKPWLERKVSGYSGEEHQFWMNHERHRQVLKALVERTNPSNIKTSTGLTAVNMVANFNVISDELDARLTTKHRFEMFVYYLLYRVVMVNLNVDTAHVPMVFEVINDRGVRLKPYEILKGKLLGQIDKQELATGNFNEDWEGHLKAISAYGEDEIDSFFRAWLKAKFSDNRKAGQRFDSDYHREMFKSDINEALKLDHNPVAVKQFLAGPFPYYAGLYERLWKAAKQEQSDYPSVYYNQLNELGSQFMLVLSSCTPEDPEEVEKIRLVSACLDRMFTLLQLQGVYDSNEFASRLFEISAAIRNKPAAAIPEIFEAHLLAELTERRKTQTTQAFLYPLFERTSVVQLNARFTRYFFARIDHYLAREVQVKPRHSLSDLVTLRGAKNGFHIEHILSVNDENLALFKDDLIEFDVQRNRLGGVLLLKGKDNISSSNEPYEKKLKSYGGTLLWNETLRPDFYKSKLDVRGFVERNKLDLSALDKFGLEELERRQKLLFEITRLAWAQPRAHAAALAS